MHVYFNTNFAPNSPPVKSFFFNSEFRSLNRNPFWVRCADRRCPCGNDSSPRIMTSEQPFYGSSDI